MKEKNPSNSSYKEGHYSNGGGHKKRSEHWNGLRRLYPMVEGVPAEIAWIIVRNMRRDPKSGR